MTHVCEMTHSHVRMNITRMVQSGRACYCPNTWRIHICDMTHSHVGNDTHMWNHRFKCVYDSFICAYEYVRIWIRNFTMCVAFHTHASSVRMYITYLIHLGSYVCMCVSIYHTIDSHVHMCVWIYHIFELNRMCDVCAYEYITSEIHMRVCAYEYITHSSWIECVIHVRMNISHKYITYSIHMYIYVIYLCDTCAYEYRFICVVQFDWFSLISTDIFMWYIHVIHVRMSIDSYVCMCVWTHHT